MQEEYKKQVEFIQSVYKNKIENATEIKNKINKFSSSK